MAIQFLSPSVFIEEVSSTVQTTQSVSPSTAAFAGFTTQGPVGEAKLVTSFDEYTRLYGDFSSNSYMTHQAAAYFSNGGRRAYILRIIPADATSSTASIQSKITNQVMSAGDGATATYTNALPAGAGSISLNGSSSGHIVPGSFTGKYRAAKTALVAIPARTRSFGTMLKMANGTAVYEGRLDTSAVLVSSGGTGKLAYRSVAPNNTAVTIEITVGALNVGVVGNAITISLLNGVTLASAVKAAILASGPASALITSDLYTADGAMASPIALTALADGLPVFDADLNSVVAGSSITVAWTAATVAKSVVVTGATVAAAESPIVTETNLSGLSSLTLDLRSGIFSLEMTAGEIPAAGDVDFPITASYKPASETIELTSGSTVDTNSKIDIIGSASHLTGGGLIANSSFINIATGAWSIAFVAGATHIPSLETQILGTYTVATRELTPIAGGEWGSNIRVQTNGSIEYFTASTASYSRQNVFILLLDRDGNYQLKETFEDLSFTDSTDSLYMPDVINELSELVDVAVVGVDEAPRQLNGIARSQVIAGGDESAGNRVITATLGHPTVAKRSVIITYTDTAAATKTIVDDGSGNLTGDVDTSYTGNTIVYTTGAIDLKTTSTINGNSLVSVVYYTLAEETIHTEDFGDTTKDYTYTTTAPTAATFSYYVAGADGTFDSTNYGRDQFTLPALRDTFDGIYALDRVEEILQVCVPDFAGDVAISLDLLDYADLRAAEPQGGDRFIILTTPAGYTAQQAADWFRFNLIQTSNYAAIYWPWIKVKDPLANNRPLTVPPLGHVAGVFARTDANKNVGKAPGGTIDGQLNYLIGLESIPTLSDRNLVYSNKINPFISTDANGIAVWGIQTIAQDARWRLINARRLFMFAEKSIFSLTQWAIFENNGPALWAKLKAQLTSFLTDLFNQGYFAGNNPSEGFKVVIDSTNNNQATIDAGQLYIDIALKPFKSVEFLVCRFSVLVSA